MSESCAFVTKLEIHVASESLWWHPKGKSVSLDANLVRVSAG